MLDSASLPHFLLRLSWHIRLTVAIIVDVLCLVLFVDAPMIAHNPLVLAASISLTTWMFRRLGLYFCICTQFIVLWIYSSIQYKTWFLPTMIVWGFLIDTLLLLIVGLFVYGQRRAFDVTQEAQEEVELAYEEQQKFYHVKDQFLQNVNHELRTPLTAIYGYLELLLVHDSQLDATVRATFLEHAMQSCDELQLLINNVLDSMGMDSERKRLQMNELAVIDIVNEVLERFDPKTLQEHSLYIDVPDYIVVRANPQHTRQVLRNLLSNAFKYAPPATPITISATLHGMIVDQSHPVPEIRISVKDAGPGIPKAEISQLFGQFVRLQRDTSGRVHGSGLGLFLSKQFVEMMGGKIWVESEGIPGEGSTFSFTLQCVPRPTIQAQTKNITLYQVPLSVEIRPS